MPNTAPVPTPQPLPDTQPEHLDPLQRRRRRIRSLAALYRYLAPGELLDKVPEHAVFREYWADARSDSFNPPARIAALRETKLR